MSYRRVISVAAVAALGIACVASDALAARVAARGGAAVRGGSVARGGAIAYRGAAVRGGAIGYRGGIYRGGYYRPGLGVAAGALVGGAIAVSRPWSGYGGYGYDYDQGYANYGYPGYPNYGYNSGYANTAYTWGGSGGEHAAAYCAQRFKSYDPASGTYLGRDGQRRPCP